MLTETEKAYLAGFFDGDGCVNIGTRQGRKHANPSYYLQVIFSQCNYGFLSRWQQRLGMGSIHEDTAKKKLEIKKRLWHLRLYDRQAQAVLQMMLPYLDIKIEQARIALEFMGTKGRGGTRAGIPAGTLRLREHYKQALHSLKHEEEELPEQLLEYQALMSSQLSFFDVT